MKFIVIGLFSFASLAHAGAASKDTAASAVEINSNDEKFKTDIADAEKRIEELARAKKLTAQQKSQLYHQEAEKALAHYDSKNINKAAKTTASPEKAVVFFTKELELNPNPQAYHLRGVSYKQLHRYSNAIEDFTAAINFKGQDAAYPFGYSKAEAYRLRGLVYLEQKDTEKALADINAAILIDPKNMYSYGDRCGILEKLGRFQEAAKDAELFLGSAHISQHDKNSFSESGQCWALVKAGQKVKGCKDTEFFRTWEQGKTKSPKAPGAPNGTRK